MTMSVRTTRCASLTPLLTGWIWRQRDSNRVVPKVTGRPAYAPGDLLKLCIYGYLNRVRSSRRLEAETHRNIQHRCLSASDDVPGPAHRMRRVDRHDLAVDQTSRCLTLGAASSRVDALIHVATCTGRTAAIDGTPAFYATGQGLLGRAIIGLPRVPVADIGREEFE
jgi:hypothetical protein